MPGQNLQTCRDRLLFLLQGTYSRDASSRWTNPLLFSALEEAERRLLSMLPSESVSYTQGISLDAGESAYIAALVTGYSIQDVALLQADGTYAPLARMDADSFRTEFSFDPPDDGTPAYWTRDSLSGEIHLAPAPDSEHATTLRVFSKLRTEPLKRLWCSEDQDGVIGFASYIMYAITLSDEGALVQHAGLDASATPTIIRVGDEMAVWQLSETQPGLPCRKVLAAHHDPPRPWYTINSITAETSGTLYRRINIDYAGDFSGGYSTDVDECLPFIVAQVPTILKAQPILMDALCKIAGALLLDMDNPQVAAMWRVEAEQSVFRDVRVIDDDRLGVRSKPVNTGLRQIVRRY